MQKIAVSFVTAREPEPGQPSASVALQFTEDPSADVHPLILVSKPAFGIMLFIVCVRHAQLLPEQAK